MNLLTEMVLNEKRRIEKMIASYTDEYNKLPKGSLVVKKIKNKPYYYLQYRKDGRVVSEYLGKESNEIHLLREKIEKRRHIEAMLTFLREEYAVAMKLTEEAQ